MSGYKPPHAAAVVTALGLLACLAASGNNDVSSLGDYLTRADAILAAAFTGQGQSSATTVAGILVYQREKASGLRDQVDALNPPIRAARSHRALLRAYEDQIEALEFVESYTPADAPAADTNKYLYRYAVNAYGVADEQEAVCELKALADENSVPFTMGQNCAFVEEPVIGQTIGRADAPLTTATIVHDPAYRGSMPVPNLNWSVDLIYVKAGVPVTFTLLNNNTPPFLFNFSIYRNATSRSRVRVNQWVGSTDAGSGPSNAGAITVTLRPGQYSYVDNVHPVALRGRIVAVE